MRPRVKQDWSNHAAPERRDVSPAVEDDGFSLIELMVVVLIIAILLAIAIPTFLNAKTRTQDKEAKATIVHGLKAQYADFTAVQQFRIDTDYWNGFEDDFIWKDSDSVPMLPAGPLEIFMLAADSSRTVCVETLGRNGISYFGRIVTLQLAGGDLPGFYFRKTTDPGVAGPECEAATGTAWSQEWPS